MFKVGDRVERVTFRSWEGEQKGTILQIKKRASGYRYLVEYDNYIGGHDGGLPNTKGKDGHCWYEKGCTIKKIEEE